MTALQDSVPASQDALPLCRLDELPLGLGRAFDIAGRTVAVFRTRKGEVFAVDNRCPHKAGPLADGMIARDAQGTPQVVCPLHQFHFDAGTGACDHAGTCPVETFAIEVRDAQDFIWVAS